MAQPAHHLGALATTTRTPPRVSLSEREEQILQLIAQGQMNREIADALFLSINTIKTHIRVIYRKIDVASRPHAIIWALKQDR